MDASKAAQATTAHTAAVATASTLLSVYPGDLLSNGTCRVGVVLGASRVFGGHQAGQGVDTANVTRARPGALKVYAPPGTFFFFVDFLAACLIGHDKPCARCAVVRSKDPRSCGMYG